MSNPTSKNQYSGGGGKKSGPPKLKLGTGQKAKFANSLGVKAQNRANAGVRRSKSHKNVTVKF